MNRPMYVASGFSRTVIFATLLFALTVPITAQRGRGAGAPRPNMLDDNDVTLRPPW